MERALTLLAFFRDDCVNFFCEVVVDLKETMDLILNLEDDLGVFVGLECLFVGCLG